MVQWSEFRENAEFVKNEIRSYFSKSDPWSNEQGREEAQHTWTEAQI
jgi:hypothetical protein